MSRYIFTVLFFFILFGQWSCTPQRKLVYFQGAVPSLAESNKFKLRIYPGDILSINVFTSNTEAYPFLSGSTDHPVSDNRSPYEKGIVVSDLGIVKLPLIGTVTLTGLTLTEASDTIEKKYQDYMQDPIVTVKKLNFKITVLGEVNKPGTYPIMNEKATLPEVLGLAGDLTQFADREKVHIIREENNNTRDFFVDLTGTEALTADNYFLHPDDIIYVLPVKRRAFQNISPSVTIFTSIITTTIIALTFIITRPK